MEDIVEMSKNNISFGSHSCRHEILANISPEAARKEIEESLRVLREKRLNFVPVFCYPNGNHNPNIAGQVKAAGYEAAVTTHYGFEDASPRDIYGLKRIGIHNDISSTIPLFASRLSGLF